MKFFNKIKDFLTDLDFRSLYYAMGIIAGIVAISLSFLFYNYFSRAHKWNARMVYTNKLRKQARELLEKNQRVKQQRAQVEEILSQDKNFTLKNYVTSLLQELNLISFMPKEPTISESTITDAEYAEIRLDLNLTNINMQQLTTLLENLEKNKRIALKELTITKALKTPTIDITLIIATLQPTVTAS